jgi:hypothetical protein
MVGDVTSPKQWRSSSPFSKIPKDSIPCLFLSLFLFAFATVDCLSAATGVCYTFLGSIFVFGSLATDQVAEDVILPEIQRYITAQMDWRSVDARLVDVIYVVGGDGGIATAPPLTFTPTVAPNGA